MDFFIKYWSQIAVIIGLIGYVLKTIFDYKIRNRELRNKYFYDLKAKKIIELHSELVEIKIMIDRNQYTEGFHKELLKRRKALDKYHWDGQLFFSKRTLLVFEKFVESIMMYEDADLKKMIPNIDRNYDIFNKLLLQEFKNEIL
ncbi:MAG: hypothetical protein KAF41_06600 [Flavobacterium sp.]|nr:hypothetical protein [Flavobacterium sp.]